MKKIYFIENLQRPQNFKRKLSFKSESCFQASESCTSFESKLFGPLLRSGAIQIIVKAHEKNVFQGENVPFQVGIHPV